MPLFLIGAGIGALIGGGTVFAVSETSEKLALAALAAGGLYWYLNK